MLCFSLNSSVYLKHFIFNIVLVGKCWQRCWNVKASRRQSELWETPYSGCQGKYQKYLKYIYKYPKNSKISLWIKKILLFLQEGIWGWRKQKWVRMCEEISLDRAVAVMGIHASFLHKKRRVGVPYFSHKPVERRL